MTVRRSSGSFLGLYTIGVAALFLAGFFLLVVFGAQSYRNIVSVQSENNQNRELLGYFATCIGANDVRAGVYISESEYGPVLEIPDGESGYGIRIYCTEGELKETYASLGAILRPEQDASIGKTETFLPEFVEEDLLRVSTDAGSILIHLRSEESGAPS